MDTSVPSLETRTAVAKWRMDLFYDVWGEGQCIIRTKVMDWCIQYHRLPPKNFEQLLQREWLVEKTRALVETDRIFMPDGPGAIQRVMTKVPEHGPG